MAGFTQTVRCLRHYASGDCDVAWEIKMYVPASDYEAFIAMFDGKDTRGMKGAYPYFSYVVKFDQEAVSRKPRNVQHWRD
jgi:hypothetical protein